MDNGAYVYKDVIGKVVIGVDVSKDRYNGVSYNDGVILAFEDNTKAVITHEQDCCESVYLEDINGDLSALVGYPLLVCEAVWQDNGYDEDNYGSSTWTFFKLGGVNDVVTLRFIGSSNGYYGEEVTLDYPVDID